MSRALVTGPLACLSARSCIIMVAHDDVELRLISTHGLPDAANDRYRTISLRLDYPIVDAYRSGRMVATGLEGFSEALPALQIDQELWVRIVAHMGSATMLDAPIASGDGPLGTMSVACAPRSEWGPGATAIVEGICGALAMWITHPRSRVERQLSGWQTRRDERLHLTVRQEVILRLVEQGRSNAQIAVALGFSPSTVKHELLYIIRILRADGRHDAVRLGPRHRTAHIMHRDPDALAPFLTYLSTFPDPAWVARAVVEGPMAGLRARTCGIMVALGDVELRLISSHGLPEASSNRYRTPSPSLAIPVVIAYVENRTSVHAVEAFVDAHPDLQSAWHDEGPLLASLRDVTVIDAPFVSEGSPLGSIGMVCANHLVWSADELALVDGICSALGLWITHPRSGVARTLAVWEMDRQTGRGLTERQQEILRHVERGRSNTGIPAAPGVSESTVRNDLLSVRRITKTGNRHDAARRARDMDLLVYPPRPDRSAVRGA